MAEYHTRFSFVKTAKRVRIRGHPWPACISSPDRQRQLVTLVTGRVTHSPNNDLMQNNLQFALIIYST